jgi:hypothetical protein
MITYTVYGIHICLGSNQFVQRLTETIPCSFVNCRVTMLNITYTRHNIRPEKLYSRESNFQSRVHGLIQHTLSANQYGITAKKKINHDLNYGLTVSAPEKVQ